jgi:DNA-binding transcriptional ArsR family regulator
MVQAFQLKLGCSTRKLILLKLADNANDQGYCWPSYQHIADLCEIDKRTAQRHIKKLAEMGYLTIEHRTRKHGDTSNMYRLSLEESRGDILPPRGRHTITPGVAHDHPEPVIEPVKESKRLCPLENEPNISSIEFKKLWEQWPNNNGKKQAVKAFKTLLSKNKGKDASFIVNSLIQDVKARLQANQFGFTNLMLSTYLNNERWLDDMTPSQPARKDPLLEAMGLL